MLLSEWRQPFFHSVTLIIEAFHFNLDRSQSRGNKAKVVVWESQSMPLLHENLIGEYSLLWWASFPFYSNQLMSKLHMSSHLTGSSTPCAVSIETCQAQSPRIATKLKKSWAFFFSNQLPNLWFFLRTKQHLSNTKRICWPLKHSWLVNPILLVKFTTLGCISPGHKAITCVFFNA